MRIVVVGLGYVGTVTAAGFASLGHTVLAHDRDLGRLTGLAEGKLPFVEVGLDRLLRRALEAERFVIAPDLGPDELADADAVVLCVGTPPSRSGDPDLSQLRAAVQSLATSGLTEDTLVVVRSTVPPGSSALVGAWIRDGAGIEPRVAINPEFMREGSAVSDFFEPARIVAGADTMADAEVIRAMYDGIDAAFHAVSPSAAESIKYVDNAFHALKISFTNEVAAVLARCDVDVAEVIRLFKADTRLNLSSKYLTPGGPYGGSCLPKDTQALQTLAQVHGLRVPVLNGISSSNDDQVTRIVNFVAETPGTIGLAGLAFKPGTSDLRESPQLAIAEQLRRMGRTIHVLCADEEWQGLDDAPFNRVLDLDELCRTVDLLVVGTGELPERPLVDFPGLMVDLFPGSRGVTVRRAPNYRTPWQC